jgi:hypothetical protein
MPAGPAQDIIDYLIGASGGTTFQSVYHSLAVLEHRHGHGTVGVGGHLDPVVNNLAAIAQGAVGASAAVAAAAALVVTKMDARYDLHA